MIHKLAIRFSGVSTHFRGVVPGVPHRVVLPDASSARMGVIQVGTETSARIFALMPHLAMLTVPPDCGDLQQKLCIDRILLAGVVLRAVRLQIVNAVDWKLSYEGYDAMPALGSYVPDFNFSSDVVVGGRAAVYFDLFGGEFRSAPVRQGAVQTVVTMRTEGTPRLMVTPFSPSEEAGKPAGPEVPSQEIYGFDLPTDELTVGNHDLFPDVSPGYDYLWHFMAMRGGIPSKISQMTPGMPDSDVALDERVLLSAWEKHSGVLRRLRAGDASALDGIFTDSGMQPSCSDARFP